MDFNANTRSTPLGSPSTLRPTCRTRAIAALLGAGAGCLVTASASAGIAVNGIGFGWAKVDVWGAPNSPPNAPTHSLSVATMWPIVQLGPNLPNCNPQTYGVVAAVGPQPFTYEFNAHGRAVGGDKVGTDGEDLMPYVTTVSTDTSSYLNMTASVEGAMIHLTGHWGLSDSGGAQRIRLLDVSAPDEPYIIYEQLFLNPNGEQDDRIIDITGIIPLGDPANIAIQTDMYLSSLPAPGPAALLGLGGLAACRRRRG